MSITASSPIIKKATFSAQEWVQSMENPNHRVKLSRVLVLGASGLERTIPLINRKVTDFSFVAENDSPYILIDNQKLKLLMAAKILGSSLFFTPNGIEARIEIAKPSDYSLRNFFQNSSNYSEVSPRFSLKFLAKAYQHPEFKSAFSGVITKNSNRRFISLAGLPPDSFQFSIEEKEDEEKIVRHQLLLRVYEADYEIEAITNKNGIVIFLDGARLTSFVPNTQIDFVTAIDKPRLEGDDKFLLSAIIHGDSESLATYIQKNTRKFINHIKRKNISEENAEDILQDIQEKYIRLVQSGRWNFEGDVNQMQAMINTMINSAVIDFFRKQKVRNDIFTSAIQQNEDGEADISDIIPHQGSEGLREPDVSMEKKDANRFLENIVKEMKPTKQFRVYMDWASNYALDDRVTQAGIAEDWGISVGTVKTHIARTKAWLKEKGFAEQARALHLI